MTEVILKSRNEYNPRFYIDHGVIHDRVTGKHVVTDGQPPFEDSLEHVLELLNGLVGAVGDAVKP